MRGLFEKKRPSAFVQRLWTAAAFPAAPDAVSLQNRPAFDTLLSRLSAAKTRIPAQPLCRNTLFRYFLQVQPNLSRFPPSVPLHIQWKILYKKGHIRTETAAVYQNCQNNDSQQKCLPYIVLFPNLRLDNQTLQPMDNLHTALPRLKLICLLVKTCQTAHPQRHIHPPARAGTNTKPHG